MSDAPLTCPVCAGERLVGPTGEPDSVHPAGILTIQHRPGCVLRDREDATHVNDCDNAVLFTQRNTLGFPCGRFRRFITPTELTILSAWADRLNMLDKDRLNEHTLTYVSAITGGVCNRAWPSLWEWFPPAYDSLAESIGSGRWSGP